MQNLLKLLVNNKTKPQPKKKGMLSNKQHFTHVNRSKTDEEYNRILVDLIGPWGRSRKQGN